MTFELPPSGDFLSILRSERRDILNRMRETRFDTLKEGFSYSQVIPFASYSPWLDDQEFRRIYEITKEYTLVDVYRCYELFTCAQQVVNVEGQFVEIGVWRGGTAALISSVLERKEAHLFDAFSGIPKPDEEHDTLYKGGEHSDASAQIVTELFARVDRVPNLHIGIFPDETLAGLPDKVAFGHIDVDVYRSALECFDTIWPRVQPGGMIVFDDYGFFSCEGVAQAVNELRARITDGLFVHNINGHALFIKR